MLRGTLPGMPKKARSHPKRPYARQPLHLRAWRKHRNLTQEQLAERSGISQGMISQLEKNATDYSGETLAALADALGCEPPDLIVRDPTDPEAPWSIWDTLEKPDKTRAIEMMKGLKRASG